LPPAATARSNARTVLLMDTHRCARRTATSRRSPFRRYNTPKEIGTKQVHENILQPHFATTFCYLCNPSIRASDKSTGKNNRTGRATYGRRTPSYGPVQVTRLRRSAAHRVLQRQNGTRDAFPFLRDSGRRRRPERSPSPVYSCDLRSVKIH
jgi:hypothetical protein